ncbi:MAG TPA: fatty acid--CoA ligase family protein, partial [Acidimicrobiales bacterium]|nr:fatty acid--CoA ligase family protein [Acidimicrobiales bacterium]
AAGSCGQPFIGTQVRIVDPDTGVECPVGETGEVKVQGRNVMRGICGRTRDVTFDADGSYHTGDLGHVNAEGYLWYDGRLDDMFKVKGATVYPTEVESAIRRIAGVRQAHVTGVEEPSGAQSVGAVVVTSLSLEEIRASARTTLSSFKVPTRWVLADSSDVIPTTATDKVDRSALQKLLREEGTHT